MINVRKILFAILIVIIVSFVITPAYAAYDQTTKKATFSLKPGWSTIPILIGPNSGNDCGFAGEEFVGLAWIWSPTFKEYVLYGPGTEKSQYQKDFSNGYYYTVYGGMFIYLKNECNLWINDYSFIGPSNFKISKGWQFVPKAPWMQKKGFGVFKNCAIEQFNQWDADTQRWAYTPSGTSQETITNTFNSAEIGDVFAIKFASECQLDVGIEDITSLQPSPLE